MIYSQWEGKEAYSILLQESFTDRELYFSYHRSCSIIKVGFVVFWGHSLNYSAKLEKTSYTKKFIFNVFLNKLILHSEKEQRKTDYLCQRYDSFPQGRIPDYNCCKITYFSIFGGLRTRKKGF